MSWQHLSVEKPKARKQYACSWCMEKILAGETHVKHTGLSEGDFQSNRFHAECDAAAGKWIRETGEDCFIPGEFKRGTTEEK